GLRRGRAAGATSALARAAAFILVIVAATAGYGAWRAVRPAFGRFAAVPAEPAHAVDGIWGEWAKPAGGSEGTLLVNVAEAVRVGAAQVTSPAGQSASGNPFVRVQQLSVGDGDDRERGWPGASRRQWLYLHPPSSVSVEVAIPARERTWLQASLALNPAIWESETGDGVRFLATVTPVAPSESSAHTSTTMT